MAGTERGSVSVLVRGSEEEDWVITYMVEPRINVALAFRCNQHLPDRCLILFVFHHDLDGDHSLADHVEGAVNLSESAAA